MPDIVLPGQPIPLPRGPVPQSGSGTYTKDAQLRASVVGIPRMDGSVGLCILLPYGIGNLTMIVFFHGTCHRL
jgi:exosome complex RNA-binding protein Rrp4